MAEWLAEMATSNHPPPVPGSSSLLAELLFNLQYDRNKRVRSYASAVGEETSESIKFLEDIREALTSSSTSIEKVIDLHTVVTNSPVSAVEKSSPPQKGSDDLFEAVSRAARKSVANRQKEPTPFKAVTNDELSPIKLPRKPLRLEKPILPTTKPVPMRPPPEVPERLTRPTAASAAKISPIKSTPKLSPNKEVISPVDTSKIRARLAAPTARSLAKSPVTKLPVPLAELEAPPPPIPMIRNAILVPPQRVPLMALSLSPVVKRPPVTKRETTRPRSSRLLTTALTSSPTKRDWLKTPAKLPHIPKPRLVETTPRVPPRVAKPPRSRHRGNAVPLPVEARGRRQKSDGYTKPAETPTIAKSKTTEDRIPSKLTTPVPPGVHKPGYTKLLTTPGTKAGYVPTWRRLRQAFDSVQTHQTPKNPILPEIASSPEGGEKAVGKENKIYADWARSPELRRHVLMSRKIDPRNIFRPPPEYLPEFLFEGSVSQSRAQLSPYSSPFKQASREAADRYNRTMGYDRL